MKQTLFLFAILLFAGVSANAQAVSFGGDQVGTYKNAAGQTITVSATGAVSDVATISNLRGTAKKSEFRADWRMGKRTAKATLTFATDKRSGKRTLNVNDGAKSDLYTAADSDGSDAPVNPPPSRPGK